MKTTARAALHQAPSSRSSSASRGSPASARSDAAGAGLAAAISEAVGEHRRQLGLAARAYAVRRAWTLGFLARILSDPLALRVGHVVAALDGTGYALTVARLPAEPVPYAGSMSCGQPRARDAQPQPQVLAPVIRLPTSDCLCGTSEVGTRCA